MKICLRKKSSNKVEQFISNGISSERKENNLLNSKDLIKQNEFHPSAGAVINQKSVKCEGKLIYHLQVSQPKPI